MKNRKINYILLGILAFIISGCKGVETNIANKSSSCESSLANNSDCNGTTTEPEKSKETDSVSKKTLPDNSKGCINSKANKNKNCGNKSQESDSFKGERDLDFGINGIVHIEADSNWAKPKTLLDYRGK